MHSKLKLALAVMTSPSAAFEEIIQRRLLGTALLIVTLTGALSMISAIKIGIDTGPMQMFALGKENPLAWLGLCMLYASGLWLLLKWLGTKTEYTQLLTVLGWSHVPLLILQVVLAADAFVNASPHPNPNVAQILVTTRLCLSIGYVAVVAVGLQTLCRIPLARAAMAYLVTLAASHIAFSVTYGTARAKHFQPLQKALPETLSIASRMVAADVTPWLAAAVMGLILGLWNIGKSLEWDPGKARRIVAAAGFVGVVCLGYYVGAMSSADYYGKFMNVQRLYNKEEFASAAEGLVELREDLPATTDKLGPTLNIADLYYFAGENEKAIKAYSEFETMRKKIGMGKDEGKAMARANVGLGMAYDQQGDYDKAIEAFKKAAKGWKELKDPWVRMAVTYDRMGDYKNAIETGNHAVKKLDSDAVVAWVALAQAFIQTGDTKQAKAAIAMVAGKDDDLAKKIGPKAEDWKTAVSKLTPMDLKFPLEAHPLMEAKKAKAAPKKK